MSGLSKIVRWENGWMYRNRGELASDVTISNSVVDLTPIFGPLPVQAQAYPPMYYDSANQVYKVYQETRNYFAIRIIATLTVQLSNNNSNSSYEFILLRPDGVTPIRSFYTEKVAGLGRTINFSEAFVSSTRVEEGGNDNFQTAGFKIGARKLSGANMTILSASNISSDPAQNRDQELIFYRD